MMRPPPSSTLFPYTPLSRSHDAARADQEHACGGRRPAGGQVERPAPHEPALRAGERHAEPAHVDRLAGALGTGRERARIAERSEEHTAELQSPCKLRCPLLL